MAQGFCLVKRLVSILPHFMGEPVRARRFPGGAGFGPKIFGGKLQPAWIAPDIYPPGPTASKYTDDSGPVGGLYLWTRMVRGPRNAKTLKRKFQYASCLHRSPSGHPHRRQEAHGAEHQYRNRRGLSHRRDLLLMTPHARIFRVDHNSRFRCFV